MRAQRKKEDAHDGVQAVHQGGGGEEGRGGESVCVSAVYLQTVFWFELTTVQKELLNRC